MDNKSSEFETDLLRLENPEIISPDLSNTLNNKSLTLLNNNPGNLKCFKTGEFRVFNTLEAGYAALLHDLNLKITGRSVWTDSTTTINDFINIYAPGSENDVNTYIQIFCSETGLQATDLLNTQHTELIARGIIKVENADLYYQLYSSKSDF
ncbi:MAG: hypothetical protein NT175_01195 [Bacteroidetes bacterium]|nr:hypothetical protein [Bacteroidota bacterium]